MLHCFQSADHCLDPSPDLLVFLQQRRPIRNQGILPVFKGAIFFLKLIADYYQFIQSPFQTREFLAECLFR